MHYPEVEEFVETGVMLNIVAPAVIETEDGVIFQAENLGSVSL